MNLSECQDWLEDYVLVPEPIARAGGFIGHGGRVQHITALEWLAGALGMDAENVGCAGFEILRSLLRSLEPVLPAAPGQFKSGSLVNDIDSGRLDRCIEQAVMGLPTDTMIGGMTQFGWGRKWLPEKTEIRGVDEAVREVLKDKLKDSVLRMIIRWNRLNQLTA